MPSLRILAALAVGLTSMSVPQATPVYAASPDPQSHRVTLITGDVVTFTDGSDPIVTVTQAIRDEPATFITRRERGNLYVTPSDADLTRLDRELFNVKGLIDQGFGDDRTSTLPVIVTGSTAPHVTRRLPSVDGVAAKVKKTEASGFLAKTHGKVWLDRRLRISLDQSVPQVGAPVAWQSGYDGTGVTVAVLDTGIDANHPDLAGRVVEARSFIEGDDSTDDLHGHGTHVASTIAGGGGRYRGVAPGAKLAVGKVCDLDGCPESAILEGMDWAAHRGAKVVNMSLGGAPTDGTDLLSQRVDELTAETGTLFVIAAGNLSCAPCVGSPGTASSALTVGAVDKTDALADFSSRGPRFGDGAVKPEIVAPGVAITAAQSHGEHVTMSGTSMATPHVAGAAAILAQARPSAGARELKDALASTGKSVGRTWYEQGGGRLDIPAALGPLSGSASVGIGRGNTGTATYENRSGTPVVLQLSVTAKGWDGSATSGVHLSATTVTVPARGRSSVDLTVDEPRPGVFGGYLTATSGGASVRTPLSWYRPYAALPTHPLTVRMIDRLGKPLPNRFPWIFRDRATSSETPNDPFVQPESLFSASQTEPGVWTAEVPSGSYLLLATNTENTPQVRRQSLLTATNIDVNGPVTVTLDEREVVRATAITPEPTYRYNRQLTASVQSEGGSGLVTAIGTGSIQDAELYALPSAPPRRGVLGISETYTLGQRTVVLRAGNADLRPEYEPYQVTKTLAGRRTLPLVFAGDGSDLPDVRGKAVLVKLPMPSDTGGLPWNYLVSKAADEVAKKALAAGAVALVPYLDVPGALPILPFTSGPRATPLPLLGVRQVDGERLRGQSSVLLDVRPNPAYMYSLHFAPAFGVPSSLTHRVRPGELLRNSSRYHSDVPGLGLHAWTFAFENDRGGTYVGASVYLQAPAAIDTYVGGATGKQFWHREARLTNGVDQFPQLDFQPYRGSVETWFAGPVTMVRPEQDNVPGFFRDDHDRLFASPYLGDSSRGHFVNVDAGHVYPFEYRLFRGDVQIPGRFGFAHTPYFELPHDEAVYRMQATFTLPSSGVYGPTDKVRTMSPKVMNEWTFTSGPDEKIPPLLQLRYHLNLDLTNHAAAGRPHALGITVDGSDEVVLKYSTDEGATWRSAHVVRLNAGRYLALLTHPATPGAFVWLRTEARDDSGNQVTQTVQRAYQLR